MCFCRLYSPADTPFEDGTFKLSIQFSEDYPAKAPLVRFVSKMWVQRADSSAVPLMNFETRYAAAPLRIPPATLPLR